MMRGAVVLLALLAAAAVVKADDFDEEFASAPPKRGARSGGGSGGGGVGGGGGGASRSRGAAAAAEGEGDAAADPSGAVATSAGGEGRKGVEEVSFILEHSVVFGPGDASAAVFKPCGVFNARAHYDRNNQEAVRLSHLKLNRDPIDDDFRPAFTALVERDLHYRVRLAANVLHPREGEYVMAYLPARCLSEAGLQENFALHMDERGNVIGIDYTTAGGDCHLDAVPVPLSENAQFRTTAAVRFHKVAPQLDPDAPTDIRGHGTPDTTSTRTVRKTGPDGKPIGKVQKVEQTLMQKYWMYIIPGTFLLANFLAAPEAPKAKKK